MENINAAKIVFLVFVPTLMYFLCHKQALPPVLYRLIYIFTNFIKFLSLKLFYPTYD